MIFILIQYGVRENELMYLISVYFMVKLLRLPLCYQAKLRCFFSNLLMIIKHLLSNLLQISKPVMEKRRRARINASLSELKTFLLDIIKKEVSYPIS